MQAIFQCQIAKKSMKAPSVRVIVICGNHRLPWQDSDKGVDNVSTSPESIPHQIIIIIVFSSPHFPREPNLASPLNPLGIWVTIAERS